MGNGTDYVAQVASGTISSATGSFDSVVSGSSSPDETGYDFVTGMTQPDTFSLQLNSQFFHSAACNNSSCLGWQQFIYSTSTNTVFMEYWLLGYGGANCPPALPGPAPTCVVDSPHIPLNHVPLTVADLSHTWLTGTATAGPGGADSAILVYQNGVNAAFAAAVGWDNLISLANGWQDAEFGVFGDGGGTSANFNSGTTLQVRTTVHNGTHLAPTCVTTGYTGETNNLNFTGTPALSIQGSPTLLDTQTNGTATTPACATANSTGDTHDVSVLGQEHDVQIPGDFVLAQTGPRFVVQTRQVSGAPTYPNADVNHGVAVKAGLSQVALCLAPTPKAPARVFINRRAVALASGAVRVLPGGGYVSRLGDMYLISDGRGNSVTSTFNQSTPAGGTRWINVYVGFNRWPEPVHGLLNNANYNPYSIAPRTGAPLTAVTNGNPKIGRYPFVPYYHRYVNSWRVLHGSMLAPCGPAPRATYPTSTFDSSNLDPSTAKRARVICLKNGVKNPALLEACTIDVAMLGDQSAEIYRTTPDPAVWGVISPPGN